MRSDGQVTALLHLNNAHLPVFGEELKRGAHLQHADELGLLLVVPEVGWRGVTSGNDPLNTAWRRGSRRALRDRLNDLFRKGSFWKIRKQTPSFFGHLEFYSLLLLLLLFWFFLQLFKNH